MSQSTFSPDKIDFEEIDLPAGRKLEIIDMLSSRDDELRSKIEPWKSFIEEWDIRYQVLDGNDGLDCRVAFYSYELDIKTKFYHYVTMNGSSFTSYQNIGSTATLRPRLIVQTCMLNFMNYSKQDWNAMLDAIPDTQHLSKLYSKLMSQPNKVAGAFVVLFCVKPRKEVRLVEHKGKAIAYYFDRGEMQGAYRANQPANLMIIGGIKLSPAEQVMQFMTAVGEDEDARDTLDNEIEKLRGVYADESVVAMVDCDLNSEFNCFYVYPDRIRKLEYLKAACESI